MINKINKIVIMVILFTTLVFARTPHVLSQIVRSWPAGIDETGVKWMIYDLYNAETHYLDQDSVASYTDYYPASNALQWTAECGNLPNWHDGDTIIAFGSWDSAYATSSPPYGSNPNHTGFYWLFSDTLDEDIATQVWSPDDTLWVMPQPYAYQVGGPNGDIQIEITNPPETRRVDQTEYDVMGYWIWADTTGVGTPDAFIAGTVMEVGFFSVVGDTGDITVCTHPFSNYHDGQTVYWAYKLVARPDTVNASADTMGYTTYYLSQNSDPLVIVGIEENTSLKPGCVKLEISPNPFTDRTDITCSMGQSAKSTELKIYDISGKLVKDFSHFTLDVLRPTLLSWDGTDESGELLPSGVYFVQVKGGDLNLTKKVILQR